MNVTRTCRRGFRKIYLNNVKLARRCNVQYDLNTIYLEVYREPGILHSLALSESESGSAIVTVKVNPDRFRNSAVKTS